MTAREMAARDAILDAIVRAAETNKSQVAFQFAEAYAVLRGDNTEPAGSTNIGFVGQRHPDTESEET